MVYFEVVALYWSIIKRHNTAILNVIISNNVLFLMQACEDLFSLSRPAIAGEKFDNPVPQPHPLPMPEYGGYFAPLTEYLPDSSQPISGFHR